MKKIFIAAFCLFTLSANAGPVKPTKAAIVAKHYIKLNEPSVERHSLSLYDTWNDDNGDATMYVFNIDSIGFIITSADDAMPPIIGLSLNGAYNNEKLPTNLKGWLKGCSVDIDAVLSDIEKSAKMSSLQQQWHAEWDALEKEDIFHLHDKSAKSVSALVETRWEQGAGYNNYCPVYNGGSGGHAITGCVATAMAQIIRYHQYPNTGFYHHSYVHNIYGYLKANFDSTYYDYSKMPVKLSYNSTTAQRNAVSLLCYHCGVSVNMNYENAGHTSGSSAHSEDVPDALKYFGYTDSYLLYKVEHENIWDSLLRHDLDLGRPVYYSGTDDDGGHAFICDGYSNNNTYHFNFGWGGYCDGNYLITNINGYTTQQAAVFNIFPSNIRANLDTMYFDPESTGDGSSWESSNPNLDAAIMLRGMYKSGVLLVKKGVYYGNTNSDVAFTMQQGLRIYGGFDGTESSIDQSNPDINRSVLSGNGVRQIMTSSNLHDKTEIYNMVFADGLGGEKAPVEIQSGLTLNGCSIENCTTTIDGGYALDISGGFVYRTKFYNNLCNAVNISGGNINNCLIVHNNGNGVVMDGGYLVNCDIVSNTGTGVEISGGKIRNCIIWNNGSSISNPSYNNIFFSAIEGFDEFDTNSNRGIATENRQPDKGPFFIAPDTNRGLSDNIGNWHLSNLSPLVDVGDTIKTGVYQYDLDGNVRFRNGRVDIGCYERSPDDVGIETISASTISVYPNPSKTTVTINGMVGNIDIYDITGRKIMTSVLDNSPKILNISHFQPGIYILKHNQTTVKIVKK